MTKAKKDLFSGIFLVLFAAALLIGSFTIKSKVEMAVGPDFIPKIVSTLLLVLGAVITFQGYIAVRANKNTKQDEQSDENEKGKSEKWKSAIATMVLMVVYAAVISSVGFLISTTIYAFLQMLLLAPKEKRNPVKFLIISVISTVVIYLAFTKGFKLMLPAGILG